MLARDAIKVNYVAAPCKNGTSSLCRRLKSLIDANTYHGDIKPDNILVSDSEDAILIDVTRTFTTMAIASTEVKEGNCSAALIFDILCKIAN